VLLDGAALPLAPPGEYGGSDLGWCP